MTSLAVDRSFECAPHATRSVAMALALSLNLAIALFAMRPEAVSMLHAMPPPSLLITILQPPPPPVQPVSVPILRTVEHVHAPTVHVAIATPALPSIAPVTSLIQLPSAAPVSSATGLNTARDSDATIAYETASPPAYPIQALRAGIQGTVLLKVLVGPTGQPLAIEIEHSSGSRVLDDAARQHVLATWRFHPAIRDGHAIEAWALVPVQFSLNRD
ncbi:MAG TPA: energy transducer TonB [Rhodanobacteraceae bacterium]|nr:energy transducer TonB [Rhodanobacteraceae bacterium]